MAANCVVLQHCMIRIGHITLPAFPLLLAPMEDVSDPPFRAVCKQAGADLMFSEFISSEGLIRDAIKSRQKLDIFETERPVGIQIFGGDEEAMALSARIVETVKPDLLDINFGCPVKKVVSKGAGAAVLKDIALMERLTKAVVRSTSLPVTVKTRLGWDANSIHIVEVAERMQDAGVQALTIHARTRCQLYKGAADWSWIAKVKENPRIHIPIFGNGDIDTPEKARNYHDRYGVDGIMIGRAAIGYPWIFREMRHYLETGAHLAPASITERIHVIREHLLQGVAWKGHKAGIQEMRRHYGNYLKGLPNVRSYRQRLVTSPSLEEIQDILEDIASNYQHHIFSRWEPAMEGMDCSCPGEG